MRALRPRLVALLAIGAPLTLAAQSTMQPVNDLPNPYRTIEGWAKMPEGRTWGSTSAVAIDRDGGACGSPNGVARTVASARLSIRSWSSTPTGTSSRHFGAGLMILAARHLRRSDDNVWVVDCACTYGPGRAADSQRRQGHQIFEFSHDGKLLSTLGVAGAGAATQYFFQPNAHATSRRTATSSCPRDTRRPPAAWLGCIKFSKRREADQDMGPFGSGPDDFDQPHALAHRLAGPAVRRRSRQQPDQDLRSGRQAARHVVSVQSPERDLDRQERQHLRGATPSRARSAPAARACWKRGIRIGSAKTGQVTAFIPDPVENATNTSAAEGVAVDSRGVIYGAEVGPKDLKRYERNQ